MSDPSAIVWGPIPALAEALLRAFGSLEALLGPGGPWALIVDRQLRGASRPAPLPGRRFWSRLLAWAARWFGQVAPAPAEPWESLAKRCDEAHAWLARQNLEKAIPWFRSTGGPVPCALGAVTDVSLFWSVAAWLSTQPPRAGANLPAPPTFAGWIPAEPADCLALHLCLERILLLGAAGEMSPARTLGGLRRQEVLAAGCAFSKEGPRWPALRQIALASPLTLIVYGDLFCPGEAEAGTARRAFRLAAASTPGAAGWRTAWLLLLARSMTGVILSPPAIEERFAAVVEEEAKLARRRPPEPEYGVFGLSEWWLWKKENERVQALLTQLSRERRAECVRRLRFLSEALAVAAADAGGVRDEQTGKLSPPDPLRLGASFFVARTWDMLVRTFLARQATGLREGWPVAQASGRMGEAARTALIFGEHGAVRAAAITERFFRQLTQLNTQEREEITAAEWDSEQCARLFNLDVFALPEARPSLLENSGVSEGDLGHAISLLLDYEHAVLLPLGRADQRDRPPGLYVARWGEILAARLPSPVQVNVQTDHETEYEYA